ncbi:Oidioi.mRNA.OKI2018_I69.XSR.g13805.t1.cds [Oikopleura dioica]|uniref:Oidioi.mRNA.OKI2018_I69.XSR.g13805.t1.cds n=1 Tax=Oikopleura dioica TaxID=34765 RepID=A0ABN7S7Y2_OIKDI|nr:Oidioi.mRNA.OKI2018_I69.XSR.g13805.t1.cds [Oikopleura dioica]
MVAFPINGSVMVNAVICQLADDGHKFNDFLGVYWHYLLVSQPLVSRTTSWIEDQCTSHQGSVPHIIDNRMFHHLTIWGKSRNITDFLVRANDDLRWLSTDTDRDAARTGPSSYKLFNVTSGLLPVPGDFKFEDYQENENALVCEFSSHRVFAIKPVNQTEIPGVQCESTSASSIEGSSTEDYFSPNFNRNKVLIHGMDFGSCDDPFYYNTSMKFDSLSWEGNRYGSSVEAWLFLPRTQTSEMANFGAIPGIAPFTPCVSKFKASAMPRACFNPLDNVTLMLGVNMNLEERNYKARWPRVRLRLRIDFYEEADSWLQIYENDPFRSEFHEVSDLSTQELTIDSHDRDIIVLPLRDSSLFLANASHGPDYHVLLHFEDLPDFSVAIRDQAFIKTLDNGLYSTFMSSFSTYTFGNGGQPFLFTVKNASSLQTKKEINFDLEQPEIGFAKENFIYGWRKDGNTDLVFDSLKYDDSRYELINSTETTSHKCFHNCIKAPATGEQVCFPLTLTMIDKLEFNKSPDKYEMQISVCDINECLANPCGDAGQCENTDGGYECVCDDGYSQRNSEAVCEDINECDSQEWRGNSFFVQAKRRSATLDSDGPCSEHAYCINLEGSYECECKAGYEGISCRGIECDAGHNCTDINECETFCFGENSDCVNTPGSFTCSCSTGFAFQEGECTDIDECRVSTFTCSQNSICSNNLGSYSCDCQKGFTKAANGECADIDECDYDVCEYDCRNTVGSYECVCPVGTEVAGSGKCTKVKSEVEMKDSAKMTKQLMAQMVDESMKNVVSSIDYTMNNMANFSEKVSQALSETAISLEKTIKSMVNPKMPEEDPFLELIMAHAFDMTMRKSSTMTEAMSKMAEFFEFGNIFGESNDFFALAEGQVGNLTLPNLEILQSAKTRTLSGSLRASQMNVNPFIHSLGDLSLDPNVFFIESSPSEVLFHVKKKKKVPPASLSCLSRSAVILKTFYVRNLISIFLVLVISWLAIHCAVGYQNLSVFDRDLLATSVFVSVVADVIFIPLLKSYALAVAKRAVNYPIIVIFPKLTAEYHTNPCSSTIFKSTTTALEMKKTVKRSKQRRDILKTLFKFLKLGLISGSLLGITNSIVPTGQSKFFIDSNIRQALEAGLEDVLSMKDIWTYLSKETISFIHPNHLSPNGEKLSEDNRKFAADLVNFRLGPAILKQHRNTCGIYEIGWKEKESNDTGVLQKMKESPLHSPWVSHTESVIPSDLTLQSPIEIEGCEFSTILGTSVTSGKFILGELRKNKWIDLKSSVVIFEQSFLQAHSNAFIQLRIIFELVDGGGVVSSLTIQQLRNVDLSDNTIAVSLTIFGFFLAAQIIYCLKLFTLKKLSFYSFFHFGIMCMDLSIVVIFIYRTELLRQTMATFTMNPKGTPNFGKLFLVQYHFFSLVSVSLFLHILYLIHIFSTLNIVRSYKYVIKSLRKSLSPFLGLLLPVQLGLASIVYLIFQSYSVMYNGFSHTFLLIIWQGYLRPSDMREEIETLPGDLQMLAKLIYLFLNFSMLFLVINIIITIICDENTRVRKIEHQFDWLPFTSYWTKKRAKSVFKRAKKLFTLQK